MKGIENKETRFEEVGVYKQETARDRQEAYGRMQWSCAHCPKSKNGIPCTGCHIRGAHERVMRTLPNNTVVHAVGYRRDTQENWIVTKSGKSIKTETWRG